MKNNNYSKKITWYNVFKNGVYLCLLGGSFLFSGCANNTIQESDNVTTFYPPLPNSPRIQFLQTFSDESDLVKKTEGFSSFILGKENALSPLTKPYGVAMQDGILFAIDTRGPGYVTFDFAKKEVEAHTGSGSGRMKKPINMVLDKMNNRYVADTGLDQVLMFDSNNKFVKAYGVKGQFKPTDLLLVDDKMFVVDIMHHKIHVLSVADGTSLYEIGRAGSSEVEKGSTEVEFFHPTNIKLGSDGNLYVSDTGNFRVQVISQKGEFVRSIGRAGSGPGNFARPKGLAIDKKGNLYVVDAAFNNIQVFLPNGELVLVFGGPGDDPGNLNLPTDLEIDYDNVSWFQQYADPDFMLEYVILVANQFGNHKVTAYGYGKMRGMKY